MNNTQATNSIASGDKSMKIHVSNGAKTLCNRKSLHKEDKQTFKNALQIAPELCCSKCTAIIKRIK